MAIIKSNPETRPENKVLTSQQANDKLMTNVIDHLQLYLHKNVSVASILPFCSSHLTWLE